MVSANSTRDLSGGNIKMHLVLNCTLQPRLQTQYSSFELQSATAMAGNNKGTRNCNYDVTSVWLLEFFSDSVA